MPYSKLSDLPDPVKALPKHGQEIFLAAFNSAFEQYKDEEKSFATAWAAVKTKYEKKGDEWAPKPEEHGEVNLDGWFEVFRTGTHTDSQGRTREWTEKDLREIASLYNPQNHEAPIVIGHPEMDSPAFGWIETLRAEGERLFAKPKQLADEFKDWVKKGLYKKVSIALYPDLGLRHVGFLGATPPAIKGLRQAAFSEKAAWEIELISEPIKFEDPKDPDRSGSYHHKKGGTIMDLGKFFSELKALIIGAEEDLTPTDPGGVKFTEAEVQAREAKVKADTEKIVFADHEKLKKDKADAEAKVKEIETKRRKDDIAAFCEAQCKEGKLTPALRKLIEPVMIFAATHEGEIEFAEGVKKAPIEILRDFMKALPKLVEFRELSGKDKDGNLIPSKFMEFVEQIQAEKKVSRSQAISIAAKEKPDLHTEWIQESNPNRNLADKGFRS